MLAGNDWTSPSTVDSLRLPSAPAAGRRRGDLGVDWTPRCDNDIGFSLSASGTGSLTARLGAVAGYAERHRRGAGRGDRRSGRWIRLTETAYTFTEDGGDQTIVVEATAASADMPAPSLTK